jgi:hypothetical protein
VIDILSTLPKRELLTSFFDGRLWHAHYPSASRALCSLAVPPFRRGRKYAPTCERCASTARAFHRIDRSCPPHWLEGLAEAA